MLRTTSLVSTISLYLHVTIYKVIFSSFFSFFVCHSCQCIGAIYKQQKLSMSYRVVWEMDLNGSHKHTLRCMRFHALSHFIVFLYEQNHCIKQVDLSQEIMTNNLYFVAILDCFLSTF